MPQSIEDVHFHYITYKDMPLLRNPCPGGHEIYDFGRPFLGHHNFIHSFSVLCLGVEKKIFKEIHQFYTFYTKITSSWDGEGVMNFTISCVLTLQMLHTKFGKDWPPVVLEKKMLTHDAHRTTTIANPLQ